MSSSFMRKQKLAGFFLLFSLFSLHAQAQEFQQEARHGKLWRVSVALLGAVTIADMQSSAGRMEANPLMSSSNGRFTSRGMALKGVGVGAMVGVQYLMLRKNPHGAPWAAGANFAASALVGSAVIHNHMLK
jgi:hypothetical protein